MQTTLITIQNLEENSQGQTVFNITLETNITIYGSPYLIVSINLPDDIRSEAEKTIKFDKTIVGIQFRGQIFQTKTETQKEEVAQVLNTGKIISNTNTGGFVIWLLSILSYTSFALSNTLFLF